MICHEYRCIFVHIPKTAGQSIEHVFLELLGLSWKTRSSLFLRRNRDPNLGPASLAHLKAPEYVTREYIEQEYFNSYFKFSFVRNPWDRIVSEYKYRGFQKNFDFKTYLFNHLPDQSRRDAHLHIIPQHDFLFDTEGHLLVDFVGRFESLQEDFEKICLTLGIQKRILPHANKSLTKNNNERKYNLLKTIAHTLKQRKNTFQHYTEYYDNESIEFVSELYKRDIDAFNYEFGK